MTNHNGIENVLCEASDDVLFAVSIDDGQTWKYYNNGWVNATTDSEGMTSNTLNLISASVWSEIINYLLEVKKL